jgi:hypothetical protein
MAVPLYYDSLDEIVDECDIFIFTIKDNRFFDINGSMIAHCLSPTASNKEWDQILAPYSRKFLPRSVVGASLLTEVKGLIPAFLCPIDEDDEHIRASQLKIINDVLSHEELLGESTFDLLLKQRLSKMYPTEYTGTVFLDYNARAENITKLFKDYDSYIVMNTIPF